MFEITFKINRYDSVGLLLLEAKQKKKKKVEEIIVLF